MTKILFVIVNYLCFDYSIKCVESIEKQSRENIELKIVIVDNCSPNDSFSELKKRFQNDTLVEIIQTQSNIGYARAMNYGFSCYSGQDFVICANDDIEFPEDGLFNWIINEYDIQHFAVMGPDVFSINGGFHQSPYQNHSMSKREIQKGIFKIKLQIIKKTLMEKINPNKKSSKKVLTWENDFFKQPSDSLTLHGALLVFSKSFFSFYPYPFDEGSYFYGEESLLKLRCDLKQLKMYYSPSFRINHYQAVSTISKIPNDNKRDLQRLKTSLISEKRFLEIIKN